MADVLTDTVNLLELAAVGVAAYLVWKLYNQSTEVVNAETIDCGLAGSLAKIPFGLGIYNYTDDQVIPCTGGTIGQAKATGISNSDLMDSVATAACGCAAMATQGVTP